MAKKVDLALIASTGAGGPEVARRMNNNNDLIVAAMERTLSRDGTSPNDVTADLDLNGHTIFSVRIRNADRRNAPLGGYVNG